MSIQDAVRDHLISAIKKNYNLEMDGLVVEIPPRTELGDLAFPVAFELAKRLKSITGQKQNPRDIASNLAREIESLEGVARVDIAGPGYLNVYFDRASYVLNALPEPEPIKPFLGGKIIVEHTSVNPNKAAHIGHIRNAVLGDTIVRLFRGAGEQVEVQNYIDNTGVQVADVIVGFKYIENKTLADIKAIAGRFDYYCWDLYAGVGEYYAQDQSRLEFRSRILREIESGEGGTYEMADYVSTRILNCHLDTMARAGIEYDIFPRESDVLHLPIWDRAFELLKERGAIEFATEGRLSGCWVMRSGDSNKESEETEHEADKVIVRSNGTVTYTGKDIAFHLWKLGQLGIDFYYKPFRKYANGNIAWVTTSTAAENDPSHPTFGNGAAYFNVIDIGQSYPQQYVKQAVTHVDYDERVERSAHLAYERVVLTPAAAEQLGLQLTEEDRERRVVNMSGRKGLGVKADDLIDQLEANTLVEVTGRHPDLSDEEKRMTAHKIAIGALRYFLLKYTRNSVISFDFKEALALNGETGVYIHYCIVRANSIFRKLKEAGFDEVSLRLEEYSKERISVLLTGETGDEIWALLYQSSQLHDVLRSAVASLEPSHIAKWAFQLAQSFNLFYEKYHILSEQDEARRALLVTITMIVRRQLLAALRLLGIESPERM